MPVIRLANEQQISFDPEAISIISAVFEKACDALGLSNRRDALTELLAKKVIEAAQAGDRDPLRIYQMVMDSCVRQLRAIPGGWSVAETVPIWGMSCAVHAAPAARD
jgi:hypothetical protein